MIRIGYKSLEATFSIKTMKWKSSDSEFTKLLNMDVPVWEEDVHVWSPMLDGPRDTHGIDGLALQKVIGFLGRSVKVIKYEPDPIPEEKEGVVV